MTAGGQDKLEEEIKSLEAEIEVIKDATTTAKACETIAEYVSKQEPNDPFLTHSGENPYLAAPSSGGGCSLV